MGPFDYRMQKFSVENLRKILMFTFQLESLLVSSAPSDVEKGKIKILNP